MSDSDETRQDAIVSLVGHLLATLDRLEAIAQRIHPPDLGEMVAPLEPLAAALQTALAEFHAQSWPEALVPFRDQAALSADAALRASHSLLAAVAAPDDPRSSYRALRQLPRSLEALYPLADALPTVSRWFLEPGSRDDPALLAALQQSPSESLPTGVFHSRNETTERGGFSVYVPENHHPGRPCPLIVALHGGAGHGRLFLWSWLREARTRGAILIAPTAIGSTWSLMDPDIDGANIAHIVAQVGERWAIDPRRRLLTGMSDGGTFTLVSGLQEDSPFTHLAPAAAGFHPMLVALASPARMQGLPVYLIHGTHDWMFPVSVARTARKALTAAGAAVTYREITGLSHTYPRDENGQILDWLKADC
jgi:phospholipase/carboxylesterase